MSAVPLNWQFRLLRWYRKNRRDLPWRRTTDPYKIWVSEIMLQQTTVATVIPYYERFLKRFPTVESLARADQEEVLRYWAGLGYYSRARNLHEAARVLCRPGPTGQTGLTTFQTVEQWHQLPGIGRYTAGAIASIAFDERAPILDGNVIRVLSRLFALKANPKIGKGKEVFWKKAEAVLPQKNCGDFNQALMELGATICLPENPACRSCPLRRSCRAFQAGEVSHYPKGKRRISYQPVSLSAALVQKNGRYLMIRRPNKGSLKGMWEFPMVEGDESALISRFGFRPAGKVKPVRHSVMNRRLTIQPLLCRCKSPLRPPLSKGGWGGFLQSRWFSPSEINRLATSSMNRKILARVRSLPSGTVAISSGYRPSAIG